ncbi:hypothetical protein BKA66DRAFT_216055 [Pyrenochaeta sp. MPI-SDFR-AT-0127]|nr:hypothetical protein BKA66DRAFT_216055 [Pyrenochaeta sp. MPI-SDFR-AT-0127]
MSTPANTRRCTIKKVFHIPRKDSTFAWRAMLHPVVYRICFITSICSLVLGFGCIGATKAFSPCFRIVFGWISLSLLWTLSMTRLMLFPLSTHQCT